MNQFPAANEVRLNSRSVGAVAGDQTNGKKLANVDSRRYSHVEEACAEKNAGGKNRPHLEADREGDAAKSL